MSSTSSEAEHVLPTAPAEPFHVLQKRMRLLMIYSLYFVVVGLPMWFLTTSIYQSNLPINDIKQLEQEVKLSYDIPIYIKLPKPLKHLTSETQTLIDAELVHLGVDLSEYRLTLDPHPVNKDVDPRDYEIILESTNGDDESVYVNPFGRSAKVLFTDLVVANGKIPDFIMKVIVYNMFQEEIKAHAAGRQTRANGNLALPYSQHYNLIFSLIVEDGTQIEWDIEGAINEYFHNFVSQLSTFTNFTIDTQIQYYCNVDSELKEENGVRLLDMKDLSTFVDFGAWNLVDQISLEPTINFLVYVPKSQLQIEGSGMNSFVIPQWGGVKIYNTDSKQISKEQLLPILEIFSSQLLTLLNFPKSPKSLNIRLDMIKRLTVLDNLKKSFETLNSLIKLVQQLLDIPIPEATLKDVETSMELIKALGSNSSLDEQMVISNAAVKASNDAFFQKDMIQQNYFPQAHKFTIYLPIAGPVVLILANSALRCLVDYKKYQNTQKKLKVT